ncbi:MAG: hypothetical protein CML22_00580 [Rheinheimera sp.]|nr:hypothetical protein [Rheinheimera sp.]MBM32783.1 hypothetical protein [Rheinheimera sp.]HAW93395.1 hypothetical protein [Candidatus Azambacteria bacterium]|tara:strand:- start:28834 stop:29058 length:225 start_codon:yes stop_codon:yes gene_type:complete
MVYTPAVGTDKVFTGRRVITTDNKSHKLIFFNQAGMGSLPTTKIEQRGIGKLVSQFCLYAACAAISFNIRVIKY